MEPLSSNEGQESENFGLLPEEKRGQIRKEIADPATPYAKQELRMPNWLVELFRDTLHPNREIKPISFWKSLLDLWRDEQARRGMKILLVLFVELLIAFCTIGIAVWKYWQHR